MNTLSVNTPQVVDSYPYGRLRTKATFSIEFDSKKGFRSVFQTINPKNGVVNKPKKGTYSEIAFLSTNEDGFVETGSFYLNGDVKKLNEIFKFMAKNFDLYTKEQIEFISISLLADTKRSMVGLVSYCNSSFDDLKPLYESVIKGLVEIVNTGKNKFSDLSFDVDAIENTKDNNFNPFNKK